MRSQLDLIEPERIWQQSLLAKVGQFLDFEVLEHLRRCGQEELYRTCKDCRRVETFYYRCSLKFCPLCNYRIARARAKMLGVWALSIRQPKHLVLTQQNFPILTRSKIRKFQRNFAKLRRTKLFANVNGGCVSIEITNEGRGWHLHAHCLLDCRFLDVGKLAIVWGKLAGQEFGIVKIKDCRGRDYLGEITKYVVKPAQLVSWPAEQICEFVNAIRGVRFFSTFGSLFRMRASIREFMALSKPPPKPCECGCTDFMYETEEQVICNEIRARNRC